MAGSYSIMTFLELFSFCGGSSLAINLLCPGRNNHRWLWIEVFADLFYSNESIHISGVFENAPSISRDS
jgi:hypothetical protein